MPLTVAVSEAVEETLAVELRQAVALGVVLLLRVPVGVAEGVPVQVPLTLLLWLTVEHREAVPDTLPRPWRPLGDTLPLMLAAALLLELAVVVAREVAVAPLCEGWGVPDTVSVMVCE